MLINRMASTPDGAERGAVAILVAASLFVLMGFAAVTVDIGAAFSERRQDQSSADMAAMVALQFARGSADPATAADNGALEAIAVANATLDNASLADWSECEDSSPLSVVSSVSRCVSFTTTLQKARVVIPTIEVATTFGRTLGVESIATSAEAEAEADLGRAGILLPFGVPGGSSGDTEVCLRTNPSTPAPCDGPEAGNFGTLDFVIYGNSTLGTQTACNPNPQRALQTNMVAGIDHPTATVDGETRTDRDYCPIFNGRPNHVEGQTGIGSALYPGMVSGSSHYLDSPRPGRLARGSNRIPVDSNSPDLDNTGLWTLIDGSTDKPSSCDGVTDTAGMATCMEDWKSGPQDQPLFRLSIADAVRFGAVPQLTSTEWGSGTQLYGIDEIVPVYIQGTFWKCKGTGDCEVIHYPGDAAASEGVGNAVNGANRLNGVSAFLLDLDMLPEPLRSNFPTTAEQVDYALVK